MLLCILFSRKDEYLNLTLHDVSDPAVASFKYSQGDCLPANNHIFLFVCPTAKVSAFRAGPSLNQSGAVSLDLHLKLFLELYKIFKRACCELLRLYKQGSAGLVLGCSRFSPGSRSSTVDSPETTWKKPLHCW